MAATIKQLIPELKAYVDDAMNNVVMVDPNSRIKRNLELHPSGFPYCGIQTLYEGLQGPPASHAHETFATKYFTSVGTLVHSLIQRAMGKGGQVWGHWTCTHSSCEYSFKDDISPYHDCPVCGSECDYLEIGFKVDNLDGHMDCLFLDNEGHWWIVDYKTTLLMRAQKHAKDGVALAGNVTYQAQQRAYCTLAQHKYGKSHGVKPKGWILVFIPRDIPFQFTFHGQTVTPAEKKETWERICHDIDAHDAVLDAVAFSEVEHLVETKPCTSLSHYKQTMENPYGGCPLVSVCFNKKQLIKTLKLEMDDNVLLPLRRTIMLAVAEQQTMVQEVVDAQPVKKARKKR